MNPGTQVIAPKKGDHVAIAQQDGVFEVADINFADADRKS